MTVIMPAAAAAARTSLWESPGAGGSPATAPVDRSDSQRSRARTVPLDGAILTPILRPRPIPGR